MVVAFLSCNYLILLLCDVLSYEEPASEAETTRQFDSPPNEATIAAPPLSPLQGVSAPWRSNLPAFYLAEVTDVSDYLYVLARDCIVFCYSRVTESYQKYIQYSFIYVC
jgi:hypothetical protein